MQRGRGDLLGEVALLDGGERTNTAIALEDVEAYAFSREVVSDILIHRPALMTPLLAVLCQRVRSVEQNMLEELVLRQFELELHNVRLEGQVRERTSELVQANQKLSDLASRDALTGCLNRRALQGALENWIGDGGFRFALLMFDVDFFKKYNDTYGHAVGDEVLRCVADVVRAKQREGDLLARYGGEEFVLLIHGVASDRVMLVAERFRMAVESHPFVHGQVTISGGVAVFPDEAQDAEKLLALADERLYRAKESGRNRVFGSP